MYQSVAVTRRLVFLFILIIAAATARGADKPAPRVDVILWFDTEDYLLPADDDADKRLAELLTQRGIRATFKVVGEKARVLEKRGRTDVIAALKKHDIAFHSNFHSVHPTPTEYLADCGLLDGVAEFVRREGPGAVDVKRIFDVDSLSCYGQPGSSWASQAIVALPQIGVVSPGGVPCYVDSGSHVGLRGKPFWYAGALIVYDMSENETRFDLHTPQALEPGKKKVTEIADRLRQGGGGLISIYYHPCEWVHMKFWDGVNFARGANPPREQWKAPPQRPADQTDKAFERFASYIDHIAAMPNVHFITARDLPTRYPDALRTTGATQDDLAEIALRLSGNDSKGVDSLVIDGKAFSPADQFELLVQSLAWAIDGEEPAFPLPARGLIGPDGFPPAPGEKEMTIDWAAFVMAIHDVRDFILVHHRVPARVFIGADPVAPADFLVGAARVWKAFRADGKLPIDAKVRLGHNTELLTARHVAKDSPGLFGGWIIHKEGFQAPKVMEIARLQAWSFKPAIAATGRGE